MHIQIINKSVFVIPRFANDIYTCLCFRYCLLSVIIWHIKSLLKYYRETEKYPSLKNYFKYFFYRIFFTSDSMCSYTKIAHMGKVPKMRHFQVIWCSNCLQKIIFNILFWNEGSSNPWVFSYLDVCNHV